MISLNLPANAEAGRPFVTRLKLDDTGEPNDSIFVGQEGGALLFSGDQGLFEIAGVTAADINGDVILVNPADQRAERLIRAGSKHNTLLITERCDQLCVMCSQPPKKSHIDRFTEFAQACVLAESNTVIGLSGGEPTLFKDQLFELIEQTLTARPDLRFHILSNGQHFSEDDVERMRQPLFQNVLWGIPLYAANAELHDQIVAKAGAHARLHDSFAHLLCAGANVELRTVLLQTNVNALSALAEHVTTFFRLISHWSIMQLENIGFAKNRWAALYYDHRDQFSPIGTAVDRATLYGIPVELFNFARCSIPPAYRSYAPPSISDWKQRYADACTGCRERALCCGFFEWHPKGEVVTPL
jgi:His-Xaa-Ser system radical SAM maturase HxsC